MKVGQAVQYFDLRANTLKRGQVLEMRRNEVALGDVVGFVDRDQQQRTGKIIRLNDKTVTLQCDRAQWRVAYSFLHRVVDVDGTAQEKFSARTNYRIAPLVARQVHKPYVLSIACATALVALIGPVTSRSSS